MLAAPGGLATFSFPFSERSGSMQIIGGRTTGSAQTSGQDDIVRDGSIETFARDVLYASQQVPVLVDFWAPWCGPCKQLAPVLEKVVRAAKGRVRLVKINVDENPEIAQQLRIQSIPTVYAFVGGQPVTGFAGAQPESQIRALVERLIGGPLAADLEGELEAGKQALARGDAEAAAAHFGRVLEEDPENAEAFGGMARALLALGERDEAKRLLDEAPAPVANHPAVAGARAALELAGEVPAGVDPADLERRIAADPDDFEARFQLANLLFLRGQYEAAMDHLLHIVKRDRKWRDDAARRQLLRFFDALGPSHPETVKGRRRLSAVLFA